MWQGAPNLGPHPTERETEAHQTGDQAPLLRAAALGSDPSRTLQVALESP